MQTIALENKRGFTLIELVIVIVLIGILAATALPKFANLTTQAQTAANQGVAGGLSAAVSVVHAAWIAAGANPATTSVTLEGTPVSLNSAAGTVPGYPSGAAAGAVASTPTHCQNVFTQTMNNPPSVLTAAGACPSGGLCYLATVPSAGNCLYAAQTGSTPIAGTTITYNSNTGAVTFAP